MWNSTEKTGGKLPANPKFFVMMARMPEFAYLGPDELTRLSLLKPQIYKNGEVLLDSSVNDENNMVILLAGVCEIEKSIDVGGTIINISVNKVYAPAVFGEVGVFTSRSRVATVVAAQRSVGLIVSEKEMLELFESSGEALNNTLWGFAKLGILRCRITAEKYSSITDRIFHRNIIDHDAMEDRILELEKQSKSARDDERPSQSLFNDTGDCLEWLDGALAHAIYYDFIPDFAMPSIKQSEDFSGITISKLGREALEKGEGEKSAKQALTNLMLGRVNGTVAYEDQIAFLKEIVEAVYELSRFSGMLSESATEN